MPRTRLIKSIIDALPTPDKEIVYWDESLPGFGLKITPKGRKVFIVLYRAGGSGSRLRKYTIGPYGRAPSTTRALRPRRFGRAFGRSRSRLGEARGAASDYRRHRHRDCRPLHQAAPLQAPIRRRADADSAARACRALGLPVDSRDLQARHHRPHHSRRRPRCPSGCEQDAQGDEGLLQLVCRPSYPGTLTLRRGQGTDDRKNP